jgi:iron-sulfur cluster repair protein YtfE (RIC family)
MNTLSEANQKWHSLLDTSYQAFLESLTALEFDLSGKQWSAFKQCLSVHIDFEQTHIEPLASNWENNTLKLIQSDHVILNRLLPRLDKAFTQIEQADAPRTELVRQLDGFIKMRNVLEHHDLREMENLYPLLDEQLDSDQIGALATSMDQARRALTEISS